QEMPFEIFLVQFELFAKIADHHRSVSFDDSLCHAGRHTRYRSVSGEFALKPGFHKSDLVFVPAAIAKVFTYPFRFFESQRFQVEEVVSELAHIGFQETEQPGGFEDNDEEFDR